MMPIRVRGRRRAGRQLELEEDVADVTIDRALADRELLGDRAIRLALRHEIDHLELARRQDLVGSVATRLTQRVDALYIGTGAESIEHAPCRLELELRRGGIAGLSACLRQQHAHACRFVRSAELLPYRPRLTQVGEGRRYVAFGQT